MTATAGFAARLQARAFVITSELVPPRGAEADAVRRSVAELAFADGLNITDLPRARPRMSALGAAAIAIAAGAEPILQMTCRDRNRIALAADALAAAAIGVGAVLPLGGDPLPGGRARRGGGRPRRRRASCACSPTSPPESCPTGPRSRARRRG